MYEDGKRAQLFCLSSILDMTRQDTVDTPRGMDDERRNRKKLYSVWSVTLKTTGGETGPLTRKTKEQALLPALWSHHAAPDSLHLTSHS